MSLRHWLAAASAKTAASPAGAELASGVAAEPSLGFEVSELFLGGNGGLTRSSLLGMASQEVIICEYSLRQRRLVSLSIRKRCEMREHSS